MSHVFIHSKIDGTLIICLVCQRAGATIANTETYICSLGLTFQWGETVHQIHNSCVIIIAMREVKANHR